VTTVVVVQARTGSSRLPGKVLSEVGGRPMLGFMLARLRPLAVDAIVVATSVEGRDDPVAEVARASGVSVVRGSESDVLGRFVAALEAHPGDAVVRLTADCPLMDPAIVQRAVDVHLASGAGYTSNTLVRTYPDGLDVEVVAAGALRAAAAEATDPIEREHVTPFVYRRPERFPLRAVLGPELLGHERWTVDTADDLARIRAIVDALADPVGAGWQEILRLAGRRPAGAVDGLTLRPALAGDDALFIEGPAHTPFAEFVEDPSVRSWVAEDGGRAVGWSQVSVRSGVGRVRRWTDATENDAAVLALLRRALADDYQVCDLVVEDR
jgi:spore coat polysaccharide biosynthesis protein SpsF